LRRGQVRSCLRGASAGLNVSQQPLRHGGSSYGTAPRPLDPSGTPAMTARVNLGECCGRGGSSPVGDQSARAAGIYVALDRNKLGFHRPAAGKQVFDDGEPPGKPRQAARRSTSPIGQLAGAGILAPPRVAMARRAAVEGPCPPPDVQVSATIVAVTFEGQAVVSLLACCSATQGQQRRPWAWTDGPKPDSQRFRGRRRRPVAAFVGIRAG